MAQGTKKPIEPGMIARAVAGVRYTLTGKQPDWFGPSQPMLPVAQDAALGRQFDYNVAQNVRQRPRDGEAVSFAQMRALADSYDLLRLMIEKRKDQITSVSWSIKPKNKKDSPNRKCKEIEAFLQSPDKEHTWDDWLRMLVEDLLVLDAPCVYPRLTYGGDLYALEPVDGSTIKRVIDSTGRTPTPEEGPAFQQVLKGLPAVDYTRDELIYKPRNVRTNKIYGNSPVEWIITTVNIAIRRQIHQLQYYTEGNIPEALIGVPEDWQPEQIKTFQEHWDSLLEGDTAARRHAKFIPAGVQYIETKANALKDEFDEWLARIVCFAFGVDPTPFIKQVNRSTSETSREQSLAEGLGPLKKWVKSLIDGIIVNQFQATDIEFHWEDEEAVDPLIKAQIDQIYIESKVITPDEVRADLGKENLTDEQKQELNPEPPSDTVKVGEALNEVDK